VKWDGAVWWAPGNGGGGYPCVHPEGHSPRVRVTRATLARWRS